MNFSFHPSLEHIALVTVASRLWNQHDIRNLLEEFSKTESFLKAGNNPFFLENLRKSKENWQKIEAKVNGNAAKLMTPVPLQKKVSDYINLIGLKILDWLEYHLKFLLFNVHLAVPSEFSFTPQGTIDKKKTAELLVRNDSINITKRYKLAAIYCLENVILLLWNDMPDCEKQKFYDVEELSLKVKVMQGEFAVFWGCYLRGEMNKFNDLVNRGVDYELSSYEHLFISAAKNGNKAATEFFLKKIDSNKLLVLKQTAIHLIGESDCRHPGLYEPPPKEYCTEVLCYLLSQACYEDKIKILTEHPLKVAKMFLNWPWQNLFSRIMIFLPENVYCSIFRSIIFKVCYDCKDFNYRKLFCDVWQEIPDTHKSYILNDDSITELLSMLLQVKDKEIIKLIFQDAKIIDKNKVILSDMGLGLSIKMIYGNELDLLSFFVKLLISSKKDMIKFKQEFKKLFQENVRMFPDNETAQIRFNEFCQILDDAIVHFRSSYDNNLSNEEM